MPGYTMTIAAAVDALLRRHQVNYHIADPLFEAPPEGAQRVRSALLGHGSQLLHVLFPADHLLDLQALRSAQGLSWQPLSQRRMELLCRPLALGWPPALPGVLGVPVAVESDLLRCSSLWLEMGGEQCVQLDGAAFRRLLGEADTLHCSLPLVEQGEEAAASAGSEEVISMTTRRIRQRLEETLDLPSMPVTAQRIIQLHALPDADARDLVEIVETDPSLAAQVVGWAASPYYAAPGPIRSVHDAIVRVLGFELVMNLALGIALGRALTSPTEQAEGFTPYWEQAVFGATAVEALLATLPSQSRPPQGLAYLSGLLHNLGYLLLAELFPPQFQELCRLQAVNPHVHHSHIERHLLGLTRDQLASWLAQYWGLPSPLPTALLHQNHPHYRGPDHSFSLLVFVAMRLLRLNGIGDAAQEPIPFEVYERLSMDPAAAKQAIHQVVEAGDSLRHIAALF